MKTVNSLSGGRTSSYIAVHYPANYEVFSVVCIDDKECAPKDKAIVQYANAKLDSYYSQYGEFIATAEDDTTLKAMMDLEQLIGREIIWVRGKSFDDVIDLGSQTRLPSWARRYCTTQMKLEPIFYWWLNTIGEKCNMRIGFRFDEYDRMERFFNNSNPTEFKIPVSCSMKGKKRQKHETFNWRHCSFPLVKYGITTEDVNNYWLNNGYLGGNLFEKRRQIEFPIISNCVGCFHKKPETLSVMANMHPEKMRWFARQEDKNMGTWLDSKIKYETLIANSENWIPEMINENNRTCDTGNCTD